MTQVKKLLRLQITLVDQPNALSETWMRQRNELRRLSSLLLLLQLHLALPLLLSLMVKTVLIQAYNGYTMHAVASLFTLALPKFTYDGPQD